MKKLFLIILALVTVIALASCDIDGIFGSFMDQGNGSSQEKYSEGLKYTLDTNDNSYKVTGIGTCTDKDIKIPPTYDGKPVTSIGSQAFKDFLSLTSVTIPDSVLTVGDNAFEGCLSLTSITIPNSVLSIGANAFKGCLSLTNITIPNSVLSIGANAFVGCSSLTTVYYAGTKAEWSKISIGSDNSNLTSATRYYYSETEPTVVGKYWRYDENGEIVIWPKAFSEGLKYTLNSDNASYSVTGIGTCTDKDIKIPATYEGKPVTSIGERAFSDCTSLTSVTIPDSVLSIGSCAFRGCSGLTSVTIPDSVLSIGSCAFQNCSGLTSVTIPDSVTSIDGGVFQNCSGLTRITIPNSVLSIGTNAFSGCSGLTSVTIPDSVTSIGNWAFVGCSSLTSVTIGNSVTSIYGYAFSGCRALTSILVAEGNSAYKSIDGNLYSADGKTLILYATGKTNESFTIPDSVTTIGDKAFYDCTSLTSVTIGNSVTSIGIWAFMGCRGLTSVTIPDSVLRIGSQAFSGCSGLTSVTIPDSVTTIGNYAFYDCTSLTTVYYAGTEAEWSKISIASYNNNLTDATRYYLLGNRAYGCGQLLALR